MSDPKLQSLSKILNKTAVQALIRWAIEHHLVVSPKSVNKKRIIENENIFDFSLDKSHMKNLDDINEDFRVCCAPTTENSYQ